MKRNSRVIVGYLLVVVGIVIPLIAFTGMTKAQLFGRQAYRGFQAEFAKLDEVRRERLEEEIAAYNERIKQQTKLAVVDPFTANGYEGMYDVSSLAEDGIFGYLIVPKLDLVKPIYLDATYDHLALGAAQLEGTNLPVGGEGTRSVLCGHRGWYSDEMFMNIESLEPGDVFYVDRGSEQLVYEVRDHEVIGPSDWDRLTPKDGEDMVTLLTCHPFAPPRPYRLLVNGYRLWPEATEEVPDVSALMGSVPVHAKVQRLHVAIYVVTAIGWMALIFVIIRFVRYWHKGDRV